MLEVTTDVACTQCGCVCDDLRVSADAGRVAAAEGACDLARPFYASLGVRRPPPALIDGVAATFDDAVARAADLLRHARSPLFYGLSRSSTAGQRAAVALADRLGGTIDTTASHCHASSVVALQLAGESTCTLGEIRTRADLVVYWGSDPVVTHPRHVERYTRPGATLVVVDHARTASADLADRFLRVEPGGDFDALWRLRAMVRGVEPVEGDAWGDLAKRMMSCKTGVVFFGLGLSMTGVGHRNVEALLRLVTDLNDHARFYARRMRVLGDVSGADSVLAWQTGYPFAVNLSRGWPRYNPGEFSAEGMLERGEVDACVLLGSVDTERFSAAARATMGDVPVISLDPPDATPRTRADVRFFTAVPGVHVRGTAYRMDEVPVPLRPILPGGPATDEAVLDAIRVELGGL